MGVGSEKVRCEMSIDINEMVRMAKQLQGWKSPSNMRNLVRMSDGSYIDGVTTVVGTFIAQSPATILALSERVATLEAQNAALQARAEALGAHKQLYSAVKTVLPRFQRSGLFVHIYHAMDEIEWAEALPLPESPTAAESEDEVCPVCGGTGWIQEGWGDYHMDGIPCSACEEREEE